MAWVEELPPNAQGVVRYRGGYRLADGRKRHKTWDHKRAALRWATAEEQKVVEGSRHDPAKGRMKWSTWCELWWPTRAMEPGTAKSQVSLRINHVEPKWGEVPLREIDHMAVQAWLNGLTPKLSSSAARQCYYQLSASLKAAVRAGVIDHSPCFGVVLPTLPPAPERYLTDGELKLLFDQFDGVYRMLVELLLDSGMRLGEAVVLHLHRVNFELKTIDVAEVWDQYNKIIKTYGKGKKRRTVPLTPRLEKLLLEWMAMHPPREGSCGFDHAKGSRCHSGLLLLTPRGAVVDPHNFTNRTWAQALDFAGIGHARPHDLRHTYASRLVTAGVSILRVQKLLGHGTLAATSRYTHLETEGHDEIRAALTRNQGAEGAAASADGVIVPMDRNRNRPAKRQRRGSGG